MGFCILRIKIQRNEYSGEEESEGYENLLFSVLKAIHNNMLPFANIISRHLQIVF